MINLPSSWTELGINNRITAIDIAIMELSRGRKFPGNGDWPSVVHLKKLRSELIEIKKQIEGN